MLKWLYERVTGTPWTTTPAWASRDGVRLSGAVYREQLAAFSDAELYAHGEEILGRLRTSAASGAPRHTSRSSSPLQAEAGREAMAEPPSAALFVRG